MWKINKYGKSLIFLSFEKTRTGYPGTERSRPITPS